MASHLHLLLTQVIPIAFLCYLLLRAFLAYQNRPRIQKEDIVYQEWFASGHSQANAATRILGVWNGVRLVLTPELLWVTSWFPVTLFSTVLDMEHTAHLGAILSMTPAREFGLTMISLEYRDSLGRRRQFAVRPKNPKAFMDAVKSQAGLAGE